MTQRELIVRRVHLSGARRRVWTILATDGAGKIDGRIGGAEDVLTGGCYCTGVPNYQCASTTDMLFRFGTRPSLLFGGELFQVGDYQSRSTGYRWPSRGLGITRACHALAGRWGANRPAEASVQQFSSCVTGLRHSAPHPFMSQPREVLW